MSDDWKGEHLIRRKPTKAERAFNTLSTAVSLSYGRRRDKGLSPSAGTEWSKRIHADVIRARITKDFGELPD